jgi:hypothetical protein
MDLSRFLSDRDMAGAMASQLYESTCLGIFALLLRLVVGRRARGTVAVLLGSTLLLAQPTLFQSPTQPYGFMISMMCVSAALSILHWAFMEPVQATPSIAQAIMSPTVHSYHGVVQMYKRMQHRHNSKVLAHHHKAAKHRRSQEAVVLVDATGDLQ